MEKAGPLIGNGCQRSGPKQSYRWSVVEIRHMQGGTEGRRSKKTETANDGAADNAQMIRVGLYRPVHVKNT